MHPNIGFGMMGNSGFGPLSATNLMKGGIVAKLRLWMIYIVNP